jgi:hypothetical protein
MGFVKKESVGNKVWGGGVCSCFVVVSSRGVAVFFASRIIFVCKSVCSFQPFGGGSLQLNHFV